MIDTGAARIAAVRVRDTVLATSASGARLYGSTPRRAASQLRIGEGKSHMLPRPRIATVGLWQGPVMAAHHLSAKSIRPPGHPADRMIEASE
jgi:hypothetical protein